MSKSQIPTLKIRDGNGNFIPINSIKGDNGKSAYEQAVDGGYKGTEEEFIAILNGMIISEAGGHFSDLNNPHKVTKEQVGLVNVPNVATNDQTPTYEEASELADLVSGEKISGAFGKIKKAISTLISHIKDTTKHNKSDGSGGAVGVCAKASDGGAVGDSAEAGMGFAGGHLAITENGGAVGSETYSISGFAGGLNAVASHGGAVGCGTRAGAGFSGGSDATVAEAEDGVSFIDAIQLGEGINENERTLQIYNYQLMDANGIVPNERLGSGVLRAVIEVERLIETLYKAGKLTEEEYNEIISGTRE